MTAPQRAPTRRSPATLRFGMRVAVSLYRWTGGVVGGRMGRNRVLLLTTTGRRSGTAHTIPLSYFESDGALFVVASNGGQPQHPAWYLNLLANPTVTIQRGRNIQTATAAPVERERRALMWAHVVTVAPSYAHYQRRATREIPIVVLQPINK